MIPRSLSPVLSDLALESSSVRAYGTEKQHVVWTTVSNLPYEDYLQTVGNTKIVLPVVRLLSMSDCIKNASKTLDAVVYYCSEAEGVFSSDSIGQRDHPRSAQEYVR